MWFRRKLMFYKKLADIYLHAIMYIIYKFIIRILHNMVHQCLTSYIKLLLEFQSEINV